MTMENLHTLITAIGPKFYIEIRDIIMNTPHRETIYETLKND